MGSFMELRGTESEFRCGASVCTEEQTVHVCAEVCQRSENLQTAGIRSLCRAPFMP